MKLKILILIVSVAVIASCWAFSIVLLTNLQ
jgi:hypothetical protein